jgi:hypothetical protein
MTVPNQNLIQEEIKRRLNSGNACYHSVQNLLSSRLLPKKVKLRINKTITLSVVLYGFETWSLTLRDKHGMRRLQNEVLRELYCSPSKIRIIKLKRMRWAAHVA